MKKYLIFVCIISLQSCSWFAGKPQIGVVLSKHFQNPLYKKFDTLGYNQVFRKEFVKYKRKLSNAKALQVFYAQNEYEPRLLTNFYVDGELDTLLVFLKKMQEEGVNPNLFRENKIRKLMNILAENKFKTIEEIYPVIARLEIYVADAFLGYRNGMMYGFVNPKVVLPRCYLPILRPNLQEMLESLNTENIIEKLEEVQIKDPHYLVMKKELQGLKNKNDRYQKLAVNLERMRWKYTVASDNYLLVNIPDFTLTWFQQKDTVCYMKVCVGAKREMNFDDKYTQYLKTKNIDEKPSNHETPLLVSEIDAIEVNPIWNIPLSIAKSEIYKMALNDPFYLSNRNIKVYYKGKQIVETDTIQWAKYDRNKFPFKFKQASGDGNALGKFKFIFDNNVGIYLHDTDNKTVFKLKNRAISHGCIRLEKPMELATALLNNDKKLEKLKLALGTTDKDTLDQEMTEKDLKTKPDSNTLRKLKPKWFSPQKNVLLMINYYTAWVENQKIEYRNDIYGYDSFLWNAINKQK